MTRLVSNEIFSPSNKIHRKVGRAKELSAPLYKMKKKHNKIKQKHILLSTPRYEKVNVF